jgi:hypothetical protein
MLYVGLDLHTKHIAVCVLNEAGQVVEPPGPRGKSPGAAGPSWATGVTFSSASLYFGRASCPQGSSGGLLQEGKSKTGF